MTDQEREVWRVHFERLKRLLAEDVLILAGPTLASKSTHPMEAAGRVAAGVVREALLSSA